MVSTLLFFWVHAAGLDIDEIKNWYLLLEKYFLNWPESIRRSHSKHQSLTEWDL